MEPSMVAHAWVCGCVDACHGTCGGQRMCFGYWFLHSVIWVLGIVLRWSAVATSTFTPRSCLAGPLPLIIDFLLSFSRMFAKGIPTAEHAFSACLYLSPNSLWVAGNAQHRATFHKFWLDMGRCEQTSIHSSKGMDGKRKKPFHPSVAWWTRVNWIIFPPWEPGWFKGRSITKQTSVPWVITHESCIQELPVQFAGISTEESLLPSDCLLFM